MPRDALDLPRLSSLTMASLLGLVAATLACFEGAVAVGLECSHDADCGPTLSCVDGRCGGTDGESLCGNSLLERGEECDDGNVDEGDACTPACRLPSCGDGFLAPGEACDDGNALDGTRARRAARSAGRECPESAP